MGEEERSSDNGESNADAFWDRLEETFRLTIDMIRDIAEREGIDLDSVDEEGFRHDDEQREQAAHAHPLAVASRRYAEVADQWFQSRSDIFTAKGEELVQQAELALLGADPAAEAGDLKDCADVLRWYQHQIHVKLLQALMSRDVDVDDDMPTDADGSTKVALIALDRSIGARSRMREHFPDEEDSILRILVDLDRLRRAAEREYPRARGFVRPGFDTA